MNTLANHGDAEKCTKNTRIYSEYAKKPGAPRAFLSVSVWSSFAQPKTDKLLGDSNLLNKSPELFGPMLGLPFMGNFGRVSYDYEANRKRPDKPDLNRFRVKYDQ